MQARANVKDNRQRSKPSIVRQRVLRELAEVGPCLLNVEFKNRCTAPLGWDFRFQTPGPGNVKPRTRSNTFRCFPTSNFTGAVLIYD